MRSILLSILLVLLTVVLVNAKPVTLSWGPSPSSSAIGYRVYYSLNNQQMPFAGTEADQPAPIDVGNVTTYRVTGLPDTSGVYFYVTAYDQAGLESGPSNIAFSRGFVSPDPPVDLDGFSSVNGVDIPFGQ